MTVRVIRTDWATDGPVLLAIRQRVFVEEQGVPIEMEHDEQDGSAIHLLALAEDDKPAGTARLLDSGQIGRMAVLLEYRKQGIGSALLQALTELASANALPSPFLHAQCTAVGFYERHGFRAEGPEFLDAGIPHRLMRLPDSQPSR